MANPSLQIGNGKFAIKENDLLGYSSSGTRFFPIPITMTRATLGTRVNPSGLIEDVELLGSELITNGDFSSSDLSSFTVIFATQEIVSQELKTTLNTSNGYGFTRVFFTAEIGKSYRILVDAKQGTSDGTQIKTQSGLTLTQSSSTTGDWSFEGIGVATSTSCEFRLQVNGSDGDFGFFDNVSVKEVTRDGLARVDYTDGTGILLVEPQRTNLVTYSEDFTSWNQIANITPTPNSTTSPSGESDGTKFLSTSTGAKVRANFSAVSGTTYTLSVYCKNIDATLIKLLGYDGANEFNANLTSEVNTSTWTRISLTFTAANTATGQIQIARDLPDTESAYFWGAQLEAGSYPTSYIKTQGSSVTRNADLYTKTGISDKINSEEGVLFVEMAALADDNTDRRISLNDGSASNEIRIGYSRFTGNIIGEVISGGSAQNINWGATGVTQTNNNKFALSWGSGTTKFYVNGSQTNIETGITSPIGLNTLKFSLGNDTLNMFAEVKQLQVFKTALSDSELATLTTI